ncbi:hypothetical protein AAFF_G00009260 [Aldrovandia affinis]|uniref:Uncharacterized protein n=1 Tax=Aldrovandia affinis TaxID=143900 RepID=A0AAD7X020_9TELE|nr:hypothetical protein AAFF_G00009260 [Aldrovandia affinis]
MVDRTTRWPEVVPLSGTTTAEVARGFIGTWIARFGVPSDLSSDRDHNSPHNCGPLSPNSWVFHSIGLQHIIPRPMACVSFHRSMKAALKVDLQGNSWIDRLPWVMLGLRTAPKEDLLSSSAELVYGQALRVPVRESRNRFGRVIRAPARYGKSVFVNSGGDLCGDYTPTE